MPGPSATTTPPLKLESALQALEGAAGSVAGPPGVRAFVARHADFWRFGTGAFAALRPWPAVFPAGALTSNGRHLATLLLDAAQRDPALAAVIVAGAVQSGDPNRPVVALCRAVERSIEAASLGRERARREELLRRLAAWVGAAVEVGGLAESPAQSALTLERLDSAALRAQEKTLSRQKRLMEAAREAQRRIASGEDLGPG